MRINNKIATDEGVCPHNNALSFNTPNVIPNLHNVIPAKAGIQRNCNMKSYFVYILASKRNGTLYIGVTNDLIRRVYEHKNKLADGLTKKYNVDMLVYYESTESIESALIREKQMKAWKRAWKLRLIEGFNKGWEDLYYRLI